jgi:hypothetical protein
MTTAIAYILAVVAAQSSALPNERMLCSLADALLVWSPPDDRDDGCIPPFAVTDCGRGGLFATDRRPVFRFTYDGEKDASLGYPKDSCGARGIWLFGTSGQMPPGSFKYIHVELDRMRRREVMFTMTLGSDGGTYGCGQFRGVARLKEGRWKITGLNGGRPIRKHDNPDCRYTKEEVLGCKDGGLTSR